MSSHREAPQISKDPVADSTDVYAFRSPDAPHTVTLIANYIPFEEPDGGPNFYEFGDDVYYDINIDNTGTGTPNIVYRFEFTTVNHIPGTFLYNDGPITGLTAPSWNRRQTYTLTRLDYRDGSYTDVNSAPTATTHFGTFPCPPCNIGPLSTPDYPSLAQHATRAFTGTQNAAPGFTLTGKVFAGQRADGFYVDLGAIFDLGTLRPFQQLHNKFSLPSTGESTAAYAVNSLRKLNVHSLALRVPIDNVTYSGNQPTDVTGNHAVIGVWTSASRPATRTYEGTTNNGEYVTAGAYEQISRLGNPLVNEVLIAISGKDTWNASLPSQDSGFANYFKNPELAALLPALYPGVFPKLHKYNTVNGSYSTNANGPDRADIEAIFLTGIPTGLIKGFQNLLSSSGTLADMVRLNVAIPPAAKPNVYGILGGDLAGFPNGRRVFDDVVTIELRALAGATLPLVDKKFAAAKPDAAALIVSEGLVPTKPTDTTINGTEVYMDVFPYLGVPWGGAYIGNPPLVKA
jgi:hypothetical protein